MGKQSGRNINPLILCSMESFTRGRHKQKQITHKMNILISPKVIIKLQCLTHTNLSKLSIEERMITWTELHCKRDINMGLRQNCKKQRNRLSFKGKDLSYYPRVIIEYYFLLNSLLKSYRKVRKFPQIITEVEPL